MGIEAIAGNVEGAGHHPTQHASPAGSATPTPGTAHSAARGQDPKLSSACQEFEGLLVSVILKEGLKPAFTEEGKESGADILREFAVEQASREVGRSGSLGIAKLLYEQISGSQMSE